VRSILLPAALLAVAIMPAAAAAGPAGFSDPEPVGTRDVGLTGAAVSADGHAVLAWAEFSGFDAVLHVALRDGARRRWRTSDVEVGAAGMRHLQAAITRRGDTVLAWTAFDSRTRHPVVAVVAAPSGGHFGAVRRVAVGNGFAAFPRLAVLRSGTVLLAFRDAPLPRGTARLRVRARPAATGLFEAPRTVATDVSRLAVAATGDGALLAWSTPAPRGGVDRALYARPLDGRGRPRASRMAISHRAGAEVRLAGSPDGRAIVSWVRPGFGDVPRTLFTRELERSLQPARPLRTPVGVAFARAAAVTIGAGGRALAAAMGAGPGVHVFAARSALGGPWREAQELTARPAPVLSSPRPVLLASGEALVLWMQLSADPGPPGFPVLVARQDPADAAFAAPRPVSGVVPGGRATGLVVATGGEHVLVAWPGPTTGGGMIVVERR
jgi:hypothetical protein